MKQRVAAFALVLVVLGCDSSKLRRDPKMGPVVLRPEIISRQAWDPGLPSGVFRHQTPKAIVILDEGEVALRITKPPKYLEYVREHNGGRDIPCHFYIDRDGHIYQGRIPEVEGDLGDVGRTDSGDVLVSMMDDTESRPPTQQSLDALAHLSAWLCCNYEITPETGLHTLRSLGHGARPGVFLELYYQEGKLLAALRKLFPVKPEEPEF